MRWERRQVSARRDQYSYNLREPCHTKAWNGLPWFTMSYIVNATTIDSTHKRWKFVTTFTNMLLFCSQDHNVDQCLSFSIFFYTGASSMSVPTAAISFSFNIDEIPNRATSDDDTHSNGVSLCLISSMLQPPPQLCLEWFQTTNSCSCYHMNITKLISLGKF